MKLNVKSLISSVIIGIILVVVFAYLSGNKLPVPLLPFMAIISAFTITGIIAGLMSKGETVVEPGISAVLIAIVSYFIITAMDLRCFKLLPDDVYVTNMVLVMLNGVLFTFIGGWAGEKLQRTYENDEKHGEGIGWGWIFAGTVVGVTVSLVFANIILLVAQVYFSYLLIALFVGLFFTGLVVGLRSPGVTMKEGALAGFLTVMINIDFFKVALDPDTVVLGVVGILIVLAIGFFAAFIGTALGENLQTKSERET